MASGHGLARRDAVQGLRQPLAAMKTLLEAAEAHVHVPTQTRYFLQQLAAQVQELSNACALLEREHAKECLAHGGRSAAGEVVGSARIQRPGTALHELVGADLLNQFERASSQAPALAPGMAERLFEERLFERSGPRCPQQAERAKLTPQEQRILDLVALGCTNRQIAKRLYLAEKTVKNYVSNMLRKLGMERRTQAAVYATHLSRTEASIAASAPGAEA